MINERKKSFLERLTGAEVIHEDEYQRQHELLAPKPKPWADEANEHEEPVTEMIDEAYTEEADPVEITPEPEMEPEEEDEEEVSDEAGLAVDMYESDNELVIQSMIAGVTPENLSVVITRDMVTIRGNRVAPKGIPEEHHVIRELYWGKFSREIELPFEIDTEGAEAVEKYGLLIIRLPKLDTDRVQQLKVKSI